MSATITGLDYSRLLEVQRKTRREWQEVIAQVLAAGGRRRCESDNVGPVTYLHGADGVMLFEIHANVPAPTPRPSIAAALGYLCIMLFMGATVGSFCTWL